MRVVPVSVVKRVTGRLMEDGQVDMPVPSVP